MFSIPTCLAIMASLGLIWAEPPAAPAEVAGTQIGTQIAKHRRARPAKAPAQEPAAVLGTRGAQAVIFEGLHVKAQTTKAGEVRVLHRQPVDMASLIRMRSGFRSEIIQTVFPHKRTGR